MRVFQFGEKTFALPFVHILIKHVLYVELCWCRLFKFLSNFFRDGIQKQNYFPFELWLIMITVGIENKCALNRSTK